MARMHSSFVIIGGKLIKFRNMNHLMVLLNLLLTKWKAADLNHPILKKSIVRLHTCDNIYNLFACNFLSVFKRSVLLREKIKCPKFYQISILYHHNAALQEIKCNTVLNPMCQIWMQSSSHCTILCQQSAWVNLSYAGFLFRRNLLDKINIECDAVIDLLSFTVFEWKCLVAD